MADGWVWRSKGLLARGCCACYCGLYHGIACLGAIWIDRIQGGVSVAGGFRGTATVMVEPVSKVQNPIGSYCYRRFLDHVVGTTWIPRAAFCLGREPPPSAAVLVNREEPLIACAVNGSVSPYRRGNERATLPQQRSIRTYSNTVNIDSSV